MKTTDSRDPLDRKIDELLSDQPVTPSADFLGRTLEAAEQTEQEPANSHDTNFWIRIGLPIAAALVFALFMSTGLHEPPPQSEPYRIAQAAAEDTQPEESPINTVEIQEILLLSEGLSGLASTSTEAIDGEGLLQTLDTLLLDLES